MQSGNNYFLKRVKCSVERTGKYLRATGFIMILTILAGSTEISAQVPYKISVFGEGKPVMSRTVYWYTSDKAPENFMEWRIAGNDEVHLLKARSKEDTSSEESRIRHFLQMKNLLPETTYSYRVGSKGYWSEWFTFTTATRTEAFFPTSAPDRIALSWKGDASRSFTVTWRTDSTVTQGKAQLAIASETPKYSRDAGSWHFPEAKEQPAGMEPLTHNSLLSHHHSVEFTGLQPETTYAYRVGDGKRWSEWFQYTTAASTFTPFSFIYFGDAQNDLKSFWSRTIRQAFTEAPKAKFIIHAGDLINNPGANAEWGEWFYAGSFIHSMIPVIATPGNHEYMRDASGKYGIDPYWTKQFTFPENGPSGDNLSETVYYMDYQGVRVISLNSMEIEYNSESDVYKIQKEWLEQVLQNNPNLWTVVTFHIPVLGGARKDSKVLKEHFKPLFEKYGVDMVLQGHDHVYARGTVENLLSGRIQRPTETGPVYVVSVSGPKMYSMETRSPWAERVGLGLQLYQVIHVDKNVMKYEAYTTTGELYDAFELQKIPGQNRNTLINHIPDVPEKGPSPVKNE